MMKSDSGWWARNAPAAPAARQAPPAPQHHAPAPVYQQPQQAAYQPPQQQVQVSLDNIVEAAAAWKGGEGTRTETSRCPSCGSDHFFSRAQGAHRGPPPAPMCYSCGFTGLFQQGDPAVWNAGG